MVICDRCENRSGVRKFSLSFGQGTEDDVQSIYYDLCYSCKSRFDWCIKKFFEFKKDLVEMIPEALEKDNPEDDVPF